jgi:hypothetical protein
LIEVRAANGGLNRKGAPPFCAERLPTRLHAGSAGHPVNQTCRQSEVCQVAVTLVQMAAADVVAAYLQISRTATSMKGGIDLMPDEERAAQSQDRPWTKHLTKGN